MFSRRGQGSLEYLLLIGGAVLVAIIAFIIIIAFTPVGETAINENIIEYKKIDLCTGKAPACNMVIDWDPGLLEEPFGLVLENTSAWRTLVVDGIQLTLWCGDVPCDINAFGGNIPFASLTIPIMAGDELCDPTTAIEPAACTPCNISTSSSDVCISKPLPFCFGITPSCDEKLMLGSTLSSFPTSIVFPPNDGTNTLWSQKIGFEVSVEKIPSLTGIQARFFTHQLQNGVVSDGDFNQKASPLFWYSSWPGNNGSSFQCNTSEGTGQYPLVEFGCEYPTGLTPTRCSALLTQLGNPLPGDPSYPAVCESVPAYQTIAYSPSDTAGAVIIQCKDISDSGDIYNYNISNTQWVAVKADVSSLHNVSSFFQGIPTGLYLELENFSCGADCQSSCNAFSPAMNNFQFYDLGTSIPNEKLMCSVLAGSPTLILYAPPAKMIGGDEDGVERCIAEFNISSFLKTYPSDTLYLGIKSTSASPVAIHSIFQDLKDHSPLRIVSLFVPK